jgi:hypothetical protein
MMFFAPTPGTAFTGSGMPATWWPVASTFGTAGCAGIAGGGRARNGRNRTGVG